MDLGSFNDYYVSHAPFIHIRTIHSQSYAPIDFTASGLGLVQRLLCCVSIHGNRFAPGVLTCVSGVCVTHTQMNSHVILMCVCVCVCVCVTSCKEPYKRDYILQKSPIIVRSLLIVATMCDVTSHTQMSQIVYQFVAFLCVTWLIWLCEMTCLYVWHEEMTRSCVWKDSFICVPWLIHMRDMTHSYVWHDSIMCVEWRIHMCDSCICVECLIHVWHDSFVCARWLVYMCCMKKWLVHVCGRTHSYVWLIHTWYDSFMCDMTHSCVTWLICVCEMTCLYMCHEEMTRLYVWKDSFICVTHSYVWHDSFMFARWLVYKVWRNASIMCTWWLIYKICVGMKEVIICAGMINVYILCIQIRI